MPAGGTGQIGHFARNPQTGKMVFQQGFGEGVEFGYGNGGGREEFGHWEAGRMGKGWIIRGFRRGSYGKGRLKTSNPSFQTTFVI